MNPPVEQKIQTSAGMETATETVNRIKGSLNTSIPATVAEGGVTGLTVPEVNVPQVDVSGAVSTGQSVLENQTAEAEAAKADAQAPVTESEAKIRETFGIINTEGAEREKARKEAGLPDLQKKLQDMGNSISRQVAQLEAFDIDNTNFMESERIRQGGMGGTKAGFNAFSAEKNLQMAVQRANMTSQLRTTIAATQAAQGNYQLAAEEIDNAMEAFYAPKKAEMQMEMFFLQRNDARLSEANADLRQAKMMEINQTLNEINRASDMAHAAVATGMATSTEIQEMMDLENPKDKADYASQILGRSAAEQRWYKNAMSEMQMANMRDQINARNRAFEVALIEEGAEMEAKRKASTEKSLEIMTLAKELIADPGLKSAVGPNPLARIGGGLTGKDARFQAKAERLIALVTGDNLDLMSGVLTDKDIEIIGSIGTTLSGYNTQGWAVREKDVLSELNRLVATGERNIGNFGIDAEQAVYWGMATPEDLGIFNQVWGDETLTTSDFDPSLYYSQ